MEAHGQFHVPATVPPPQYPLSFIICPLNLKVVKRQPGSPLLLLLL